LGASKPKVLSMIKKYLLLNILVFRFIWQLVSISSTAINFHLIFLFTGSCSN
jgi:hypothetical protein